jgi:hypothetical protein
LPAAQELKELPLAVAPLNTALVASALLEAAAWRPSLLVFSSANGSGSGCGCDCAAGYGSYLGYGFAVGFVVMRYVVDYASGGSRRSARAVSGWCFGAVVSAQAACAVGFADDSGSYLAHRRPRLY